MFTCDGMGTRRAHRLRRYNKDCKHKQNIINDILIVITVGLNGSENTEAKQ